MMTAHFRRMAVAAALLIPVAGCDTLPGEAVPVVEVRTTAETYTAPAQVTVRVRNPTRNRVFFAHCNDRLSFTVQSQNGSIWSDSGTVDGLECSGMHGTKSIESGGSYERTFDVANPGTYRLRFLTGRLATSVGQEIVYSNTFTVN